MYRKTCSRRARLTLPGASDWDFIAGGARKIPIKAAGVYGICLRGKAGWGEKHGRS